MAVRIHRILIFIIVVETMTGTIIQERCQEKLQTGGSGNVFKMKVGLFFPGYTGLRSEFLVDGGINEGEYQEETTAYPEPEGCYYRIGCNAASDYASGNCTCRLGGGRR